MVAEILTPTQVRLRQRSTLLAITFICVAVLIFSGTDATAKWLGTHVPVLQLIFMRYLSGSLFSVAIFNPIVQGTRWRSRAPVLQVLRALCLAGSTVTNFMALRHLQLAETVSIGFAAPLAIAALAGPVLGEWIDAKRWIAILVGFAGVIVVASPDPSNLNPYVLLSLGAMAFNTVYTLITRKLAGIDDPGVMVLMSNIVPLFIFLPVLPSVWQTPSDTLTWVLLFSLGIGSMIGHIFLVRAFAHGEAPIVAPFTYSQLIWMGLIGFFVFGDVPSLHTLVGAAIVVASGIYLLYAEMRRYR
jgi:drug/metabolite transporter (DMT)-like permease